MAGTKNLDEVTSRAIGHRTRDDFVPKVERLANGERWDPTDFPANHAKADESGL